MIEWLKHSSLRSWVNFIILFIRFYLWVEKPFIGRLNPLRLWILIKILSSRFRHMITAYLSQILTNFCEVCRSYPQIGSVFLSVDKIYSDLDIWLRYKAIDPDIWLKHISFRSWPTFMILVDFIRGWKHFLSGDKI